MAQEYKSWVKTFPVKEKDGNNLNLRIIPNKPNKINKPLLIMLLISDSCGGRGSKLGKEDGH